MAGIIPLPLPMSRQDFENLDYYFEKAKHAVTTVSPLSPDEVEDDIAWVTNTSLYRS
jgi:hypothetical protein